VGKWANTDSTPMALTTSHQHISKLTSRGGLTHIGFTCVKEESNTVVDQLGQESTRVVHTVSLE
jgi:hypothetical protein